MRTPSRAGLLAWSIGGVTAPAWAASPLVARSGPPVGMFEVVPVGGSWAAGSAIGRAALVSSLTGALIASRQPGHPTGWPFLGTGLQGLADRLGALGGGLDVRSSPSAGTTIEGSVPT